MDDENKDNKRKVTNADLDGFGFRAGYKNELDCKFRKAILDNIPEGKKVTVFIKEVVVEWAGTRQGVSQSAPVSGISDQLLKIKQLEARLLQLENQIRNGKFLINPELAISTDSEEPDEEVDSKIDDLINSY